MRVRYRSRPGHYSCIFELFILVLAAWLSVRTLGALAAAGSGWLYLVLPVFAVGFVLLFQALFRNEDWTGPFVICWMLMLLTANGLGISRARGLVLAGRHRRLGDGLFRRHHRDRRILHKTR